MENYKKLSKKLREKLQFSYEYFTNLDLNMSKAYSLEGRAISEGKFQLWYILSLSLNPKSELENYKFDRFRMILENL